MKRIFLSLLALLLVLSPALGARRSGGSFGGRSMSRLSVTHSYSTPRPRVTYQRSTPRVSLTPRTTARVTPRYQAPPRTVIVHHTSYSSAFPYFYLGAYWPHPQAWYPAGTVFTDSPAYTQGAPVGQSHAWIWLLVIAAVIVLAVLLARKQAR